MKWMIAFILLLTGCNTSRMIKDNNSYSNITATFSPGAFEQVKDFILAKGERRTYRNFDNHNPYLRFGGYEAYLGADIGQRNLINDPALSDFNELTILDRDGPVRYYIILIVRSGDLSGNKHGIRKGMTEGNVYLLDDYGAGLPQMKKNLPGILQKLLASVDESR